MKKLFLTAGLLPMVLAVAATVCSLSHTTMVHISRVHPELAYLSSIYVDARGFPFPMWATNNLAKTGFGETKSAILYDGIFWNMGAWALLFYLMSLPIVAYFVIAQIRQTLNQRRSNAG